MSRITSSAVDALAPTASIDVRRAGWGAILAAIALFLTPLIIFVGPLLGVQYRDGAAAYDPVTNASWTGGLFGLLELTQAIGIAFLVVGVGRALPSGWGRDLGALAGTLWIGGLTLHASAFMVQFTQAQADNWRSISDEVNIRATIGAAVTVIEWAFFGVTVFAALAWTIALYVAGRPVGIIGRGAGVPAIVIASIAGGLAAVGIIPPAATLLQIPLWLIVGIVLVRRSATLRY